MTAKIIDGKAFAAGLREKLAAKVASIKQDQGFVPGLAVVLVGENPASKVYVRNKAKQTVECDMQSFEHKLPNSTSQEELLALVDQLNNDPEVNGILVQLPLPDQIDDQAVINAIAPEKDVDGFHVINAGRLMTGGKGASAPMVPCTPLGCLMLLRDHLGSLSGLNAVVVGRSNIVGKPMGQLLLAESCTVTTAHSRTKDLPSVCRNADILVAAVGRPEMIRGDWIKPGATVVDVGINRIEVEGPDGEVKGKLVGDVATAEAVEVAGAITPVPGGVGPMTIACLLANTLTAACRQRGLPDPEM
ncbi:MAG: bifunctional methylenetetrahydrofolate dehydrogenase/methenyltetrahydrofolate cyclohydrolase FolD [Kiloniellales bacterium]|nr:bifunctional methylenetetrahydrofolate dehydrogenase/methenyltetrahydrofolate cyclohydrolase FolD [Kiloniellales bacterium]